MKKCVLVVLLAGVVALLLGVITQLVGHAVIITAAAWNDFAQTLVLMAIGVGVLDLTNKK
ncbi:MAG: hypothetical protein KAT54_00060 [Candidatus Marinimicrobia bacterium]|nr:hypothetical protein [Candidatus Neomarinimicrobiota bacterium]